MNISDFVALTEVKKEESNKEERNNIYIAKPINNTSNIAKPIDSNINNNNYPSIKDITDFVLEHNIPCNIDKFYSYYSRQGWKDNSGEPLANWRNMAVAWAKKERDPETVMRMNRHMADLRSRIETAPSSFSNNWSDIPVENLPEVRRPKRIEV